MKVVFLLFYLFYFQSLICCNNIQNTWYNLSKQSVIKCHHENYFNWNVSIEKFVDLKSRKNQVVNSFKCGSGEIPATEFTFKGKIKDFKLEGPGKLRILDKEDEKRKR